MGATVNGSTVRRVARNGDEQDVFGGWRKWYCYTQNAGVCKRVKRRANRRERAEARRELRKLG